jgi:predicted flap endonuclease-1-like 5' DNA nuclease
MMRWLIRMAVGGAILALLAYLWSSMNSDLEDDDLDDDIPLEFEVPLESILPASTGEQLAFATVDTDTGEGPGANLDAPVAAPPVQDKARVRHGKRKAEDDLTIIRGIGPVFQKRLNDLGISTFRQLADSSVDKLTADGIEGVGVDLESWIEQARDLATQKEA